MQETQKFKLKLIEGTDPFSAEPLNQNMELVEAALEGLATRVRMVAGSYTGNGQFGQDHPTVLEIADAERPPAVLFVSAPNGVYKAVLVRGTGKYSVWWENFNNHDITVEWTDKGARWYSTEAGHYQLNSNGSVYHYVALI